MFKNKKAGMPISIVLLVIAVLVLITTSLLIFSSRESTFKTSMTMPYSLEEVYSSAATLDFFVKNIADKIQNKEDTIAAFRTELQKYKDSSGNWAIPEMQQFENQLDAKHIISARNLNFEITFNKIVEGDGKTSLIITYSHNIVYRA